MYKYLPILHIHQSWWANLLNFFIPIICNGFVNNFLGVPRLEVFRFYKTSIPLEFIFLVFSFQSHSISSFLLWERRRASLFFESHRIIWQALPVPRISVRRLEELTCLNEGDTVIPNPQKEVGSYRNFCIRRSSRLGGVKGKSLLQAAMEWKKPSAQNLINNTTHNTSTTTDPVMPSTSNPEEIGQLPNETHNDSDRDNNSDCQSCRSGSDDKPESSTLSDKDTAQYDVFVLNDDEPESTTVYSDGNGYFYQVMMSKTQPSGNVVHSMVCPELQCKGRADMFGVANKDACTIVHKESHTCTPGPEFQQVSVLRERVLKRSSTDLTTPLSEIFSEESAKLPSEIKLSFRGIETSMRKARTEVIEMSNGQSSEAEEPVPGTCRREKSNEQPDEDDFSDVSSEDFLNQLVCTEDEYVPSDNSDSLEPPEKRVRTKKPKKPQIPMPSCDGDVGTPAIRVTSHFGKGFSYTDGNGHFYRTYKAPKREGNVAIKCVSQTCEGSAILKCGIDSQNIIPWIPHSCEPNPHLGEINELKNKIFQRCSTDLTTPIQEMFNEETMSPDVLEAVRQAMDFTEISANMDRIRCNAKAAREPEMDVSNSEEIAQPSTSDPDETVFPDTSIEPVISAVNDPHTPAYTVERKDTQLYTNGNGYFYRKKSMCHKMMLCTWTKCRGRATLMDNHDYLYLDPLQPHSCEPNPYLPKIWALRKKIVDRCSTDLGMKIREIFNEEVSSPNVPEAVRKGLNFDTMKSVLEKKRSKSKARQPSYKPPTKFPKIGPPKRAHLVERESLKGDGRRGEGGGGKRIIEFYTDGDGYFYRRKGTGRKSMVCVMRKCTGRATLTSIDAAMFLSLKRHHSCQPNIHLLEISSLKKRIINRCATDLSTPLKQIFQEETSLPDIPEAVLNAVNYRDLSGSMSHWRRKKSTVVPEAKQSTTDEVGPTSSTERVEVVIVEQVEYTDFSDNEYQLEL